MRLIIAALALPIFLALAGVMSLLAWILRGGPEIFFAAWPVLLFYHDRFLITFPFFAWTRRAIDRIQKRHDLHRSLCQHIPPRWFLGRVYDQFSDPAFAPFNAIIFGAVTLRAIVYLLADVFAVPALLHGHGIVAEAIANSLSWLASLRIERGFWDWVCVVSFAGFVAGLMKEISSRSLLVRCEKTYKSILNEINPECGSATHWIYQNIPPGWIPPELFETNEVRAILKNYLKSDYAIEGPAEEPELPAVPQTWTGTPNLDIFAFSDTPQSDSKRLPLAASYSLLNPHGVQLVVLDEPVSETSIWSKFKVLHEVGHLRSSGIRSLLMTHGAVPLGFIGATAILWLKFPPSVSNAWHLIAVAMSGSYVVWILTKWWIWDREGYSEFCADLYAFGHLEPGEIQKAYKQRQQILVNVIVAPIRNSTNPFHGTVRGLSETAATLTKKMATLVRYFALWWMHNRCQTQPRKWRAKAHRPPFQFRLPSLLFSAWCIFAAFIATIGFRGVIVAWLFVFSYYGMNSITAKNVEQLDKQVESQKPKASQNANRKEKQNAN